MANYFREDPASTADLAYDFLLQSNGDANGFQIKNLAAATDANDAVRLSQVNSVVTTRPLADVLLVGNTSGGTDIDASSSEISTIKLKTVGIEPLAFPVETSIAVLGNLDMGNNTDIDFGTDVAIRRQNVDVLLTDGSNAVLFPVLPVCSDVPSSANQLVNKAYVDAVDVGTVDAVIAGTGIAVDSSNPAQPVVSNLGLLSASSANSGLTISSGQTPIFTNTGVLQLTQDTGIVITGSNANKTITNSGVIDLSAGSNLVRSGNKLNYTLALAPSISLTSGTFDDLFCQPMTDAQVALNHVVPSSQAQIINTYYINDNVTDIQTVYDAHSAEQGTVFKIGPGSYGGSTLTITNSSNQLFLCDATASGSTITELASGRGLAIVNSSRIKFEGLQIEGSTTVNGKTASVDTNCIFSNCELLGGITIGGTTAVTGFLTFYNCAFAGPVTYNLGTATCYFINCSFGNQVITNAGLPTRMVITNAAGLLSTAQTNYVGYGQLVTTAGASTNVQNSLATPFNTGSISSAQIEVSSDPSTNNALARKSYVDTKVSSVSAGTAISVTGTATVPIINNTGVTSLIAGDNITISSSTGAVTISSTGGGGGGNHENVALLNSTSSLTESGSLALPLGSDLYNYQIEDTHFGDAKVSLTSVGDIQITGGGTSGNRTFSIQLQFRLDTNAASSSAGPITFILSDYTNQERFFCGEFDPQAFLTAKQIFFYNEIFTLTLPYSSSDRTYRLYLKDDVNKWQNGGSITQWTVTNVKTTIWYYGQIGFNANVPTPFTPPISVAPTITSITATGSSTIELNWSNVSGAENYYIYRSTDNVTFTLVYVISSIYNTYTDSGLNPLTTYYYKIGASNDEGVGPLSAVANATTEASTAPTFSDYWTDGRAPFTNFGGSYIHPSSDAIILSAVMTKLGSGPTAIYMIRRQDGGSWAEGTQHSPVVIKNGFPGAGTPLQGEYTTRSEMLLYGGGGCTWDSDIAGVTWNIGQTKTPYNLPYNVSTNPYGYSNWP